MLFNTAQATATINALEGSHVDGDAGKNYIEIERSENAEGASIDYLTLEDAQGKHFNINDFVAKVDRN